MKKMQKVVAVALVVAAMALAQSAAFATPTQGAAMSTTHSDNSSLLGRFLSILSAIWGADKSAIWGAEKSAIWGADKGSVWGG